MPSRCGPRPTLSPTCLAKDRVLHCVASRGVDSSVVTNRPFDGGIRDAAPRAGPRLVQQSWHARLHKPPTPFADRLLRHVQVGGDRRVGLPGRTPQHDSEAPTLARSPHAACSVPRPHARSGSARCRIPDGLVACGVLLLVHHVRFEAWICFTYL